MTLRTCYKHNSFIVLNENMFASTILRQCLPQKHPPAKVANGRVLLLGGHCAMVLSLDIMLFKKFIKKVISK